MLYLIRALFVLVESGGRGTRVYGCEASYEIKAWHSRGGMPIKKMRERSHSPPPFLWRNTFSLLCCKIMGFQHNTKTASSKLYREQLYIYIYIYTYMN